MKKQFAVLGLGTFGKSVALTLESLGCDVVAVDNSLEKVQDISESVAYAMRADVADPEALQELGARTVSYIRSGIPEPVWRKVWSPRHLRTGSSFLRSTV